MTYEAAFSLVVDEASAGLRRLPSLYVNTFQVFADREIDPVLARLDRTLEAVRQGRTQAVYALQPCSLNRMTGIYAKDLFNRSPYRMKLSRLGMSFASDPYPVLTVGGRFRSIDAGEFSPAFLVVDKRNSDDGEPPPPASAAQLIFALLSRRFGAAKADEIGRLRQAISSARVLDSSQPEELIDEVQALGCVGS